MNIGFISIFILVILLCIPVYLIYFFKLNLQHKVALAIGKAVGFLALTGIIYKLELSGIALHSTYFLWCCWPY